MNEEVPPHLQALVDKYNAQQASMLDVRWKLGFKDRGMGHGDFGVITTSGRLVVGCPSREVAEHLIEAHNKMLDITSYPIYILDLPNGDVEIVFPENKEDLDHVNFWETQIVQKVCELYGLDAEDESCLSESPYCMRRARITSKGYIFFGEEQSDELLTKIREAVDQPELVFQFDDHEVRLEYDQLILRTVLNSKDEPTDQDQ